MKVCIIGLCLSFLAVTLMSCSEEPRHTQVWGQFNSPQCIGELFKPEGTLARSGADYYGFCTRDGDDLNFAVGQKNPQDSSFDSEFYFEVRGIKGPPNEGVYQENGSSILDDQSLYTTFSTMRVMCGNQWLFTSGDIPNPDDCYIRLFAEPLQGELTSPDFGEKPFELYVKLECRGLSVENPQGALLTGASFEVFFDECD